MILVGLNSVNPLQTVFMTDFVVQNTSGEPLRLWVAGQHEAGSLHLLPLFATAFPALPSLRTGGFRLADQRAARIIYDWDDINFSVVVVQRDNGELRAIDVDTQRRGERCCQPRAASTYAIPRVDGLRSASPAEVAVLTEDGAYGFRLASAFALPLVPVGFFWWFRRLGRPCIPDGGAAGMTPMLQ